jgi:transposase-like protein
MQWSLGRTVADVSRWCEVNANVLHRSRREMREDAGQAFAGAGRSVIKRFRVGADVYIANEVCTPTLADKLFLSNPAA